MWTAQDPARAPSAGTATPTEAALRTDSVADGGESAAAYTPPLFVEIGHVRDLTKGSSSSGKADANSQYYYG
ncbi:lasso RiPP family leader peptide-containing protein [Uniformispora flossi]|uniref:lasso RiPP family leader peptide-containing protein n=1 Tax=Uniformispora flossi TaxID=3390723 RepID=UPI003C30B44C